MSRFLGDDWYSRPANQAMLLLYLNTRAGREACHIAHTVPQGRSIIAVGRNRYVTLARQRVPGLVGALGQVAAAQIAGRPLQVVADIRPRNKITRRLAALQEQDRFVSALLWAARRWETHGLHIPGLSPRLAFAAEATLYPDPSPEVTSVDGEVRGGPVDNSSWSTIRDHVGSSAADGNTYWYMNWLGEGSSSGFKQMNRGICLIDTSSLTGATVDAATFSAEGQSSNASFVPLSVNIVSAAPASNTALVAGDFNSLGTTKYSTKITHASWNSGSYNDWVFNASGQAAIDVEGITKLGARDEEHDLPDSAPTSNGTNFASRAPCDSGEAGGEGSDPKLVITYTGGAGGGVGVGILLLLGAG